jgi:hypothetical protein
MVSLRNRTIDAVGQPKIIRVDNESPHAKSLAGGEDKAGHDGIW